MSELIRHRSELSDLHLFYAVAIHGGLGAAAKALRVDPSTVTRTLDQLEARLNARLVRRGPQGTSLTQAGELALSRIRTIEHLVAEMEREIIDAEAKLPEGRVGLEAPDGVSAYILVPELPALLRENPQLDLGLDCGLSLTHPLRVEPEIKLSFDAPSQPDHVSKIVAHMHYALFASRKYLDVYGEPKTIDEILRHPYIHHAAQTHSERMSREVPAFQDLANRRLETNSSAAVVEAVRGGVGIAALPTAIVPLAPDLVMIGRPAPSIALRISYHREAARIPRVRAVIDWIEEVFSPQRKPWFREEYVDPATFLLAAGSKAPTAKNAGAVTA